MSDPLQSGLAAGQAAYSGAAPQKRMGISAADLSGLRNTVQSGLSDAAAQRQVLATNAAKQTAGQYPTSGTSAAMYNYLRGQGGYPVNAVPSGQPVNTGTTSYGGTTPATSGTQLLPTKTTPIQKPYEQNVNVGTPTQTTLTNTAKNSPTKMGTVTQPTVNMPKPSLVNQLLATAGPMYLGYSLLDKTGGLGALTGAWDTASTYWNTPSAYAAGQAAQDAAFIPNTGNAISNAAPAAAEDLSYLYENNPYMTAGPAVQVADASGSLPEALAGAGDLTAGTTAGGYAGDAAAWDAATAGEYGGQAAGALSDLEVAQAATSAEAAGLDWAAMAAEYGPYAAAALILDQATGGNITKGIGDVVKGAGDVVGDVAQGAGDVVSDIASGIGGGIKSVASFFGFADGGQIKHYADGGISAAQGISVGSRPDPSTDGVGYEEGGISQAMPETTIEPTVGRFAAGGISHLGGYSDGGRLLRGPGDGVSDSIPATIGNKQPARLADGEFVVPARIVSELGNGSTEAGARKLYAMMDRVQKARGKTVGKGKVAKNTRADKYLPG